MIAPDGPRRPTETKGFLRSRTSWDRTSSQGTNRPTCRTGNVKLAAMNTNLKTWIRRGTGLLVVGAAMAIATAGSRAAADTARTPTFTKDVAPIFQAKCESCHRPNNMAPMSLITYEDVRPWVRAIGLRVESHQM